MDSPSQDRTHASLFSRLRRTPKDEEEQREFEWNWREFTEKYGPMIYQWCRPRGLREAEANDVTQDVLVRFIWALPGFKYDPSKRFRGWLQTVTEHVLDDLFKKRKSVVASQNDGILRKLEGLEAREDLQSRLAEQYDLELLEVAKRRVQGQVEPLTWNMYVRTAEGDELPAEVAAALGVPIANVYKAESNVRKRIKETYLLLEHQEDQS